MEVEQFRVFTKTRESTWLKIQEALPAHSGTQDIVEGKIRKTRILETVEKNIFKTIKQRMNLIGKTIHSKKPSRLTDYIENGYHDPGNTKLRKMLSNIEIKGKLGIIERLQQMNTTSTQCIKKQMQKTADHNPNQNIRRK